PRPSRRPPDSAHHEGVRAAGISGSKRRPYRRPSGDRRPRVERGIRSLFRPHRGLREPPAQEYRKGVRQEVDSHHPRIRLHARGRVPLKMIQSVRARLTLWYCGLLAVVLVTFGFVSYARIARAIRTETDASLSDTAHELSAAFREVAAEGH